MTIMIIGGTGFLGSNLARHLIQNKNEAGVVMFDASPNYARIADIQDQVTVVQGDMLESTELLESMKRHDVDQVVHLAYVLGPGQGSNPLRTIRINCMGTTNVFETARLHGVKRVVFSSSGGLHPLRNTLTDEEVNEDVIPRPDSIYGACKLFNECEADIYWNMFGLDVIGLRPTGVFGLGRLSRVAMSQNHWLDGPGLAFMERPVLMPPDAQVVDWIHVMDAAEALYQALTVKNPVHRIFNMNSGSFQVGEWTRHLLSLIPKAKITISAEPLPVNKLLSNERLRTELGWQPQYTPQRAMEEYLQLVSTGAGLP